MMKTGFYTITKKTHLQASTDKKINRAGLTASGRGNIMMRTQVFLPEQMVVKLEKTIAEKGGSKGEIIRLALNEHYERLEGNKMEDYGTVVYKGKTYTLTAQADFTGRADLGQYEDNSFELSASAVDGKGNEYIVYWIFVDDKENLDEYDYNKVDRVEAD